MKKTELIRFTTDKSDLVYLDLAEKIQGRGFWISARKNVIQKAVDRELFSKAVGKEAHLPDNLVQCIEELLVKRIIQNLSIARKAGHVIGGYEKVRSCLLNKKVSVMFAACDGALDSVQKMKSLRQDDTFWTNTLTKAELGIAFGREIIIHAVMIPGGLAQKVIFDATRLQGFRDDTI